MLKHRSLDALVALALCVVVAAAAGCSGTRQTRLPAAAADPSVLAVYGGEALTVDEFERRYVRAVGSARAAAADSMGAYQDFLERFVNYRLKVMAAQAAGLNTDSAIVAEIETYRTNLARPYLLEQEVLEPLARDLYDKQREMIDVSHILLRVEPTATPAETLAVYQKLEGLLDSLAAGADFAGLATRHSEDPSARMGPGQQGYQGRLGFFSAGRMVQPFEEAAYDTPVGETSGIFRTQYGYHILTVHERQAAVPDIRVAHIMTRGASAPNDSTARAQVEEALRRIQAGEAFADVAREVSIDRASAAKGGDLGYVPFSAGLPASFKDAAFAIDEVGGLSPIVETQYGFHLIQLTERKEAQTFAEAYPDLKTTASRMPRAQEAERALAREIMAAQGAGTDLDAALAALQSVPDDSLRLVAQDLSLPAATLQSVVANLGDTNYTLDDLLRFASEKGIGRFTDRRELIKGLLDDLLAERAIDYEAGRLEERDEAFSRIMDEFRDGLILFKLMEDSVWTAAERDSVGLATYFEAHRADYSFPERTRIIGLHSRSDSTLTALSARLDAGTPLAALVEELAADTLQTVRVDTMLVAGMTGSVYDGALALEQGGHTAPVKDRRGFVVLVNDGTEAPRPKTFEEARTEVVSTYQQILEDRLVNSLRARYDAHTFPARLTAAFTDGAGSASDDAGSTASR